MARPIPVSGKAIELQLQSLGIATAQELARGLGIDRATISRGLGALGSSVLRIGAARSTRYALRRNVRNLGNRWPLYRIDGHGRAHELGVMSAMHGGFLWEAGDAPPAWFQFGYTGGVFPGLPFPLSDVRPQGFLGRAIARTLGPALGAPTDPRNWRDDDILSHLLSHGSDTPGDLVVGDPMLSVAQSDQGNSARAVVAHGQRGDRYPAIAAEAMIGEVVGSSAGGEQPKFTALVRNEEGTSRHVMVKFTAPVDTPAGRRWADLLAAEHHALAILASNGDSVAGTELIDAGGRRFLEITRFDREGAAGRRGVVTLQAVEAGLLEEAAADWPAVADAMETARLLRAADSVALRRRFCFGQLIGNTDMHLGNAAVWFGDVVPLRLAPAYDMLPMIFAPGPQGEIIPREFQVSAPLPRLRDDWSTVLPWAQDFWRGVADDEKISADFRKLAVIARAAVANVAGRFG